MSAEFFAGLRSLGNLDQLDGGFVQRLRVGAEAAPVAVGLLGDDLAFFDQPLQHTLDVEAVAAALKAERQVFEIDEYRQRPCAVRHGEVSRDWDIASAMFGEIDRKCKRWLKLEAWIRAETSSTPRR